MALAEPVKKGGRVTKKEQEERRMAVYELHFVENKPALEIARVLNVNRNTINDDIKFWRNKIGDSLTGFDIKKRVIQLFQKRALQRERLLENLEEAESFEEKEKVEKFIAMMDEKEELFLLKLIGINKLDFNPPKKHNHVAEDILKKFLRNLIFENLALGKRSNYSYWDLQFEYIRQTQSEVSVAEDVVWKMDNLGLDLCILPQSTIDMINNSPRIYDIEKFAEMRGYFDNKELAEIRKKSKF